MLKSESRNFYFLIMKSNISLPHETNNLCGFCVCIQYIPVSLLCAEFYNCIWGIKNLGLAKMVT